jgi:hypothetical protein
VLSARRARAVPLDPVEKAVHGTIVQGFAATGHPPPTASELDTMAGGAGFSITAISEEPHGAIVAIAHDFDVTRRAAIELGWTSQLSWEGLGSLRPEPPPHVAFGLPEGVDHVLLGLGGVGHAENPADFVPCGTLPDRVVDRFSQRFVECD